MHLGRGLATLALALPAFAQYAGPAILARGEAPAAMANAQLSFRPFIELTSVYYNGLAGVSVDSSGDLGNTSAYGIELSGGVSGSHSWRHTHIGLDYKGGVRHYAKSTYYDSTDQSLMLGITQQFSRHTSLTLRESGGLYSQAYGLVSVSPTTPFEPSASYVPTTDFFDNRTMYAISQADFTYQKTARLSFDVGGDAFLNRRRSSALYGVSGISARADVEYRATRRATIGANYIYSHYAFRGVFSSTDVHGVAGSYAVRLTRDLEFSGYAGFMRVENKFVQDVPVDPAVTALIGITQSTAVVYGVTYVPNFSARLARTFQHGVAYVDGGHTITPGNGLFLTSATTLVGAGYTYTGLRRWSASANANCGLADSIGNVTGRYGNVTGALSMSRQIMRAMHLVAMFAANRYQSADFSKYNRLVYSATFGVGFSPGDVPLRIW